MKFAGGMIYGAGGIKTGAGGILGEGKNKGGATERGKMIFRALPGYKSGSLEKLFHPHLAKNLQIESTGTIGSYNRVH
ncbi:hypothetical protein HY58_18705 [Flavihumibacter sp. ZG627]|nr:hypothetical protein HY58_18705 [Flavihumibacter sp. ZG627]